MPTASRVRLREESADDSSCRITKSVSSSSPSSKKLKTSSSSSTKKLSSKATATAIAATKANVGNNGNTDDDDDLYTIEKIVNHHTNKKTGITTYRTRWLNYTTKDDTWEPLCNIASTGHVDRYIRTLHSKTLSQTMSHVALIEYDDGETELVNMSKEIFRPYNEDHDDDDMLYTEGGQIDDDEYENNNNDYGLLVVGPKIEILWKYAKMYFPCKILSYVIPPPPASVAVAVATATTATTTVPAIPPMEEATTAATTSTSIIDYLKKAWSPSRL
jgi:hypothetical protein